MKSKLESMPMDGPTIPEILQLHAGIVSIGMLFFIW
jgi:hypothetical protein